MARDDRPDAVTRAGTWARWWPIGAALALLVAFTVTSLRALLARTGGHFVYALDDAYIHMALAKNVAEHGVWGCTPLRFSSASSSPLWTAMLAIVYVIVGVSDWAPLFLNVAFAAAALVVADRWLRRLAVGGLVRVVTLCGLLVVFPLPAMGLFGMEHVLHLALTIAFATAAIPLVIDSVPPGMRRSGAGTWTVAMLGALLATSRYEGAFLVALVCLSLLLVRRWRDALIVGAVSAAPLIVFGAYSMSQGALFLPSSLVIKAGDQGASFVSELLRPVSHDVAALAKDPALGRTLMLVPALFALVMLLQRRLAQATAVALLWLGGMVLLHVRFELSSPFWVYRYDAYLIGLAVVIAGAVAGQVATALRRWERAATLAPALGLLVLIFGLTDVRAALAATQQVDSAYLTYRHHYQLSRFLRQHYNDSVVVINDVGAMSYYTHGRVLDMFGLCDIEPVTIRRATGDYTAADVERWTSPFAPRIAVVQLSWGWVTRRIPPSWREAAEVEILPEGDRVGFFAIAPDVSVPALAAQVDEFFGTRASLGYRLRR